MCGEQKRAAARGPRHAKLVRTRSVAGGVAVQVRGGGGPKCSAGMRRGGATGQCELRTRFAGLSLAKYRGVRPPVSVFAKEGPRSLECKSTNVSRFTSVSDDFCLVLKSTERHQLYNKVLTCNDHGAASESKQPA
jgi:hypothetical protein